MFRPAFEFNTGGKMLRRAHAFFILSLTLCLTLVGAGAASAAENTSNYWSNNALVGGCGGEQSGSYVALAQTFLSGYGTYSAGVDDLWGSKSLSATKTFQAFEGLTQDGCIGASTWAHMQPFAHPDLTGVCGSVGYNTWQYFEDTQVRPGWWFTDADPTYSGYRHNTFEADITPISPVQGFPTEYDFTDRLVTAPCG